jgi:DNA-binding NarL/FixJ family response regulator
VISDDRDQLVRVLIAEDDHRVRAALRSFLSASPGFEVVGDAANAAGALEMARAHAPDIALVDVHLPRARDGFGLLRALTGELGIPVVAISIHGWVGSGALAAGACRFLNKDIAPERLLAALRSAVPGRQWPQCP